MRAFCEVTWAADAPSNNAHLQAGPIHPFSTARRVSILPCARTNFLRNKDMANSPVLSNLHASAKMDDRPFRLLELPPEVSTLSPEPRSVEASTFCSHFLG